MDHHPYMFMNIKNRVIFLIIIFLAITLRFYKLDLNPPHVSWDEAANGYNSWSVANWGKDEYGRRFPFFLDLLGTINTLYTFT